MHIHANWPNIEYVKRVKGDFFRTAVISNDYNPTL